ncbi:phospholipase A2 inhibitor subunit gamma A-like [Pygocentrus nattereri]|uniref:phospholipase A2 inhibitor subunit gamma A-like n=1 Tax=Pygocentrus nattereri TaxID=42514 RepID=UPI001890DEFD|nr:phospholipase A2 inhibitor subunit gamma A-like [Pygocentrus nattereri]
MCASYKSQCTTVTITECEPGLVCSSLRYSVIVSELGVSSAAVARICLEQDLCSLLSPVASGITYSANFGVASVFGFVSCCDNDLCNSKIIPEVDNTPNGLICPTCNSVKDPTCNSTVFCVGNQDRCANGTLPNMQIFGPAVNMPVMGCVSKSVCEATSITTFTCTSARLSNRSEACIRLDLSLLILAVTATLLLQ